MKKRFLAVLLAIVLVTAMVPVSAGAAEATVSGTAGDNITWSFSGNTLTIRGKGAMADYTSWYAPYQGPTFPSWWTGELYSADFGLVGKITKVVIEEGVTHIGDGAFHSFSDLTSVTIPGSVTSIGAHAFSNTGFSSIIIPDTVTEMGNYTFSSCNSLTSVTLPSGLKAISTGMFDGCGALPGITIPGGVTSIGDYSFDACPALEKIELPAGLKSIGRSAFNNCAGLTSIVLPDGLESLGNSAFWYCQNLEEIVVPDSLTYIGENAFWGTPWLEKQEEGGDFFIIGGILLEYRGSDSMITIPSGVKTIGENAFGNRSSVTSITVPEGVTTLADSAFYYLPGLTEISLPSTLKSIGQEAFEHCTSLKSITIPDGVTSIEKWAFWDTGITEVNIPASVQKLYGALGQFEKITVDAANPSFTALDNVIFTKDGKTLVQYPTKSAATSYDIPEGTENIGGYALNGAYKLLTVTLPSGVKAIGERAFRACENLEIAMLSDSLETIGEEAFVSCTRLFTLTVPYQVSSIGAYAFGYGYTPANSWRMKYGSEESEGYGEDAAVLRTVVGYTGSAAETYAKENGLNFTSLGAVPTSTAFTDVAESAWYYTPVQWAVANGITSGTSETTFSPGNQCTRAQAVTFLWNAKGQPEPKSTKNPFTDVKSTAWYYKAVLWAVENGITSGTSPTTFSPNNTCTRGQIVTFFHNYAGKPAASGKNPFTDVPEKQWYYQPILWAVSEGVTAGLTPTTFGPTNTCTRGQIVTFLYNYLGK